MKVLILGHKGMLGHMLEKYLTTLEFQISTTDLRWPSKEFKNFIVEFEGDFIVNCIGAIHQRTNQFDINFELPEFLDQRANCKIIHPGTDCEMDSDNYGLSKKRASDWIKNFGCKTRIIKSSILGPEINHKVSLFEWFLKQNEEVKGYSEYYWNGNTTLTWAKHCVELMNNWDENPIELVLEGECISKYKLLLLIREVFQKEIVVTPITQPKNNKCLKGNIRTPLIKQQLIELKNFISN